MKTLKIFNSEKEAKELEGILIKHKLINTELNNPMLWLFHSLAGEFTSMQRLKSRTRWEAKLLRADYAIITNTYKTFSENSIYFDPKNAGYFEKENNPTEIQTIKVNFYKNNLNITR